MINIQQYRQSIETHQQRVLQNSQDIIVQFSSYFPSLMGLEKEARENILTSYISLHDSPKMMNQEELRNWDYSQQKTILECLHEIYGIQLADRPTFIDELNFIEERVKSEMLRRSFGEIDSKTLTQVESEMKFIEWVSDITDTAQRRGSELGMAFDQDYARTYFQKLKNTHAIEMSAWLIFKNYAGSLQP